MRELIERAITEGLLAAGLIMDMRAGAVIYRNLMKHLPIDEHFAAQLVDVLLATPQPTAPTDTNRKTRAGRARRALF